jgi:hypothetical protein
MRLRPDLATCIAIGIGAVALGQVPASTASQPVFTASSITPSKGNEPYPLMPGMFVTIYGSELGPASACVGQADKTARETASSLRPNQSTLETLVYPTTLCDTRVLVGSAPAGLLYVSDRQINFKVPQSTPLDGTAELRVEHRGRSSAPLVVKLGAGRPQITLEAPAYANLPIWIDLDMPFGLGDFQYPPGIHPAAMYCYEIEMRRNKVLLPRLPNAEKQATMPGVYSGGPCGVLGLPSERRHKGRLPLHLLYRLDQPGTYEVRLTRLDSFFGSGKTLAVSEWTTFVIAAAPPQRRAQWLAELSGQPQPDATALLEDFLPGVLGVPDAASLAIVAPYLYHPDSVVRRFTVLGLGYWTEDEQKAVAMRLLRERGPTDVTSELFRGRSEEAVELALPYLQSASSVSLTGALAMIRSLILDPRAQPSPSLRARVDTALVEAANYFRDAAGPQTLSDYASVLGQIHTAPAHEALWRWVDGGIAREQSTIAITWHGNSSDLPRLAKLLEEPVADDKDRTRASIPYALRRSYGEDALPYLECALQESPAVFVRTNSARELVLAGRPAGFAFFADAIGNNRWYKAELAQFIRNSFAEMRSASEADILAFVRQRSAR